MKENRAIALYHYLSSQRYAKTQAQILAHFDCSKSSFDRAKRRLRDEYGLTILPPANDGYRLLENEKDRVDIGGKLVTQNELIDLLQIIKLLRPIAEKSHLVELMDPLRQRLSAMLLNKYEDKLDFIDIFSHGERLQANTNDFALILSAFYKDKRLKIQYVARSYSENEDALIGREVSPQKLLRYRSNWYLIAWCHQRKALRTFSVDKINAVQIMDKAIHHLPERQIKRHYGQTYGIFSGEKKEMAVLKFAPTIAPWVRDECWHAAQCGQCAEDGGYHLSIPIGDDLTELVMQLAMYGEHVVVLSPPRLKEALLSHHQKAIDCLKAYKK